MTTDEQLQRDIEHKSATDQSADAKAYRAVFRSLEKETYELPYGFADRVLRRVEAKQKFSVDHLWLAAGLFFLGIASLVTVLMFVKIDVKIDLSSVKFISGYGGLIIFSVVLIAAFHWADRTFVQKRTH